MCGILGVVAKGPIEVGRYRAALDSLAHRGPDGEGEWRDAEAGIWFGHRRLSIIDLSHAGDQPMLSPDGRFALIFNGEIYNYVELKRELIAMGASFVSESDSEVIIEGYRAWGRGVLDRLNGMFAFMLFDRANRTLLGARDRYGEKPFLFVSRPDAFMFGSEYKALLSLPGVGHEYDELRLLRAACNPSTGLDADRQTVFRDVQQLLPGEAVAIDLDTLRPDIWRYYAPRPNTDRAGASEADIFAEFRDLLTDSVRIRLRSDVPVGSCLSGGLDSSAIVCIARELVGADADYNTFTGHFPDTPADELHYAQVVIDATGVKRHLVEPTVDRLLNDLPRFIWHNELPTGGSSQFAQWCVFHLAKQHDVTVLLDGQGADELLGGYETYFGLYVAALQETGDTARLERELPEIQARYGGALNGVSRSWRDRLPFRLRHLLANRLGAGSSLYYAIEPGVAQRIMVENGRTRIPGFNTLSSALAEDSFGGFLTTLLRYGDRNSMAHSREVRLPFCDHRLADFALSLPPHLLMGEVQNKRLLRESMRGILPEEIRTRWRKQGFNPPQDLWFKSPRMIQQVRDIFASDSFRQSPFWMAGYWDRMLARVEAGEDGLGWTLWQPFIIESWRREFLGRIGAQQSAALRNAA
ncbi:MAG: asparagine synthase (glutamine-hydrolyzing) [Sphingomonas sp.]|uniref:asparagine synthase (glutamine-hydrolyzing) n=1 Tax=Sphingomonas sp. TaxID=28214 RepID=UPI0011F8AC4E|nr:asparagine synthase (glutamine-hydrolyzing) [Sphingomonas sp.]THD37162.1 MAG: asparagine synthase (glutamine-hydrolyzing) [Sphingomonas sp.]